MNRMLHLGVGNFFRAHQAWYTQMAGGWRITGVSLRRPDMRDALIGQDWRYGLKISDAKAEDHVEIDVLDRILVAPEDPGAVLAAIADPEVTLITLTITEKGYNLGPDGRLDLGAMRADLDHMMPVSAIGYLARGLAARAKQGAAVSVLSCDNLAENGATLEAAVRRFTGAAGLAIEDYLDAQVRFPSCMVDRITPALDPALEAEMTARGLPPRQPVATERFSDWVIEDRFAAARPNWEIAGAVFTSDVTPFELRKLRMLNGAHSAMAYAGITAGHEFVHQAIADPAIRNLASGLMQEAADVLPASIRQTAPAYEAALMARFANPALAHRLRQIAMDGSLKLPIRLLSSLRARNALGLESPFCLAGLNAYAQFLRAEFAANRPVEDPNAQALRDHLSTGAELLSYFDTGAAV